MNSTFHSGNFQQVIALVPDNIQMAFRGQAKRALLVDSVFSDNFEGTIGISPFLSFLKVAREL
jgi:hypothetical protein